MASVLVWNRVRIWRARRHAPTTNSKQYPPGVHSWNWLSHYSILCLICWLTFTFDFSSDLSPSYLLYRIFCIKLRCIFGDIWRYNMEIRSSKFQLFRWNSVPLTSRKEPFIPAMLKIFFCSSKHQYYFSFKTNANLLLYFSWRSRRVVNSTMNFHFFSCHISACNRLWSACFSFTGLIGWHATSWSRSIYSIWRQNLSVCWLKKQKEKLTDDTSFKTLQGVHGLYLQNGDFFNPLTPQPPHKCRPKPPLTEPRPFYHLWRHPLNDKRCQSFAPNSSRGKKSNERDPKWERSLELGQIYVRKTSQILLAKSTENLVFLVFPLLAKKCHLRQRFLGIFYLINKV